MDRRGGPGNGRRAAGGPRRGSALLIALVMVLLLAAVGLAFVADSRTRSEAGRWGRTVVASAEIADAGVDMARQALYAGLGNGWNDELAASAAAAPNPDPALYPLPPAPSAFVFGRLYQYAGGTYRLFVTDDNDGDGSGLTDSNVQVVLDCAASIAGGATCRVRATVYFEPATFSPTSAIIVGGNLRVNGNPTINGTNGSVHANGDLIVGGSPAISQAGSASGTVQITGNPPAPAQGWQSGAAPVPLPDVNPALFRPLADYVLAATGRIYDAQGALVFDASGGGDWNGLSYQGGGAWKQSGNQAPPAAAYYVEGPFALAGSPGSPGNPVSITIYAEGSIEVSGNAALAPRQNGILFLTRRDLKITGTPNQSLQGFMGAHEQLMLAGNPALQGAIVAEDAEDLSPDVTSGTYIDLTGNFTLTFNGGLTVPLSTAGVGVKIRSWERVP